MLVGGRGSDSIMRSLVSVSFFRVLGLGCLYIYDVFTLVGQFLSIQVSWDSRFPVVYLPMSVGCVMCQV